MNEREVLERWFRRGKGLTHKELNRTAAHERWNLGDMLRTEESLANLLKQGFIVYKDGRYIKNRGVM